MVPLFIRSGKNSVKGYVLISAAAEVRWRNSDSLLSWNGADGDRPRLLFSRYKVSGHRTGYVDRSKSRLGDCLLLFTLVKNAGEAPPLLFLWQKVSGHFPDPGFENTTSGWTTGQLSDFPTTMLWKGTWGPGAPRSGTYSYVFSNWADGYWRTLPLGARAGEHYDLYAYIRGELDADTTQGRFLIRAKFMDNNGASLGYSDITAMYPGAISSWTRVGGRVTAPANSVSMQVQYLLYMSSGWVNIDDVEVTIVPPNAATEVTKYYMFGGQRIAMRKNGVLTYLHADHLGSTVLETNITGTVTSDEKYLAYGKQRDSGKVVTDHRFTGQKEDASGLQYFNARFYDPVIGMFVSPDTIVPDGGVVSDYNRYLAFRGNPLRFKDPTGHFTDDAIKKYLRDTHKGLWEEYYNLWTANKAWMDMLYTAVAGDIFATIDSSSGASSFYQFTGEGKDVLTGAVDIYGLAETGPSIMLEVLRPNSNEAVASGLLRLNGESFEVVETMSFRQKGKPSTSYYLEAGKPLTKMQSYGWKLAQALGFTGMGTAVGEGITRGAVWKLGPQIAGKYNGAIFIASALGGFATEQLLEGTAANIGWEEGHQQIFLHSLTVSYNEYVTSQTIVGSWWWVPPQPGGAVAQ